MNGFVSTSPPGPLYVRALYDYEADDRTSLSFHEGDVIQVITQLESGWWDGVINGVRGWFPSNYCQIIATPDEVSEHGINGHLDTLDDDVEEGDLYDDAYDQDEDSEGDIVHGLPLEGTDNADRSRADFWIPQATTDGRLFYYNMMTGDRRLELPLESPMSANEAGPRDRMNVVIPDKTRPPPEMMARGLTQDEDYDSATSASEVEGEVRPRGQRVCRIRCFFCAFFFVLIGAHRPSLEAQLPTLHCRLRHPWTQSMVYPSWAAPETIPSKQVFRCLQPDSLLIWRQRHHSQVLHTIYRQPLPSQGPFLMTAQVPR